MCSWRELVALAALLLSGSVLAQGAAYPGVGRAATPKEIAAWDIDVRPDFKGLPAGAGSVAKGQAVWEAKCASCHGIFGESGEVFNPLVGGTSKADVEAGRVARLTDGSYPGRTTLMKLAHVSTLWDYINRAMPWTNPKTLSVEEVYAVTAYLLNMGDIVPGDFVLSDRNIADVQKRLPNRDGMTTRHGLWPGPEFGGAVAHAGRALHVGLAAAAEPRLASFLPEFARDAHGNLAEQNRPVGAQRGVDTSRPSGAPPAAAPPKPAAADDSTAAIALAQKHGCTACHGLDTQLVGPAFREIAKKHAGRADALPYLMNKIKAGGSGVWGSIPMPPQTLPDADAQALAGWLAAGAGKNP